MRRVLLGGVGIALGVFAPPAGAQDIPGHSAAPYSHTAGRPADPANRAARLGRPVATPDVPVAGHVTPAGLTARGQVPPPVMLSGLPVPSPMPPPPGGAPSVTVIRDPYAGVVSAGPAAAFGVPVGVPVVVAPGGAVVPSVAPGECVGGACPQPVLDAPLVGGAAAAPGFPALSRLAGMGASNAWASAEYLAWWTRSTQLPALAATGPVPASPTDPVTTPTPILSGSFGNTLHGGLRIGGGFWFNDDQRRGVDARMFFLFRNGTSFTADSSQYPVLGRPFFNVNQPLGPLNDLISAPGRATGSIAAHLENSLWGAEVNYRRFLAGGCYARLDGLVGFRYLNFKEELSITESGFLDPASPLIAAGRAPFASATDRFRTENNFYGGQIGLAGEVRRGRWFVDGRASIAFGTVQQTAQISGGQVQGFANGTTAQFAGGLLALPGANIGTFSQNKFAVLPEVGMNLGYHITPHLRVFAGYNFLYLSSVLRPAGVIDTNVDAARVPNFLANPGAPLPGVPRPGPQFNTTDFWAQGISVGLSWVY